MVAGRLAKRARGRPRDDSLPERRREEILSAATRLFAAEGFGGTDLQVVADTLGVGKGTLYRYFPSKTDLFLAAVDRGMRMLREAVDAESTGPGEPLLKIGRAIGAYLRFFREHPELCELLILERAEFRDRKTPTYFEHRRTNARRWHELYAGLIERGIMREIAVERISETIGDLVYGTMFTNFFAGRKRQPEQQAAEIVELVFRGILTERGNREWAAARPRAGSEKSELER